METFVNIYSEVPANPFVFAGHAMNVHHRFQSTLDIQVTDITVGFLAKDLQTS